MSRVRHAALTHAGLVRAVNEDAVVALPEIGVYAVADGMGGHEAGDLASATVVEALAAVPEGLPPARRLGAVRAALEGAHEAIRAESLRRGGGTIGTTVVALVLAEGGFAVLWAGDSRLYRFREGVVELLTTDHSAVAELVLSGRMGWDEVEGLPGSNVVTRAVGVGEALELEERRGEVRLGDRLLLCSDGLNRHAGFGALCRTATGTPIETICDRLLKLAVDGGAEDNVSMVVVDVD